MNILDRCAKTGVIPVVVIEKAEQAVPTAHALSEGGVDVMEITLRTSAGLGSIRDISQNCSNVLVGAGTVVTLEQCQACVDAGAKFIVSPGFNPKIVNWCIKNSIAVLPGCVTPTEIMAGMDLGLSNFKFFPANVYGGLKAMKSLSEPFGGIKFVPTGGVNGENLKEYASAPFVKAVGGSWLCTKADIAGGNYDQITRLTKEATAIIAQIKNNN